MTKIEKILKLIWDYTTIIIGGGILIYLWLLSSTPSLEIKGLTTLIIIPMIKNSVDINWIKKGTDKINGIELDVSGIESKISGIEKDIEWIKEQFRGSQ